MNEKKKLFSKIFGESQIERDVKCPIGRTIRHTLFAKKYGNMMEYHMNACEYWAQKFDELTAPKEEVAVEASATEEKTVNGVSNEDGLYHPFKPLIFH